MFVKCWDDCISASQSTQSFDSPHRQNKIGQFLFVPINFVLFPTAMPVFDLLLRARLTNISELSPSGDDFQWCLKVRCSNCMEVHDKWVFVCAQRREAVKGLRGFANLKLKCRFCGRENLAGVVEGSVKSYREEDSEKVRPVVRLECRGMQPVEFSPRDGWRVVSNSNCATVFSDVDLTDGEWMDYDDDGGCCVEIFDVQTEIKSANQGEGN
ncbi:CXXC motif containing zinc binding protein [Taenia crassiceps]|uniref:CXXC motif containing zinc binding protein n=1 Tax=Taenia crassiceps TaxID=6207 RepID=A0ABR4QCR8_9CEST